MSALQGTLDEYLVEEARTRKDRGHAAGSRNIADHDRAEFIAAVEALPAGTLFTVNTLREELDRRGVTETARPHLFRESALNGYAKPHMVTVGEVRCQASIPSTGASAKGAYVKVWRRNAPWDFSDLTLVKKS